ncbi:Rieske 2Fe-2S domain-containing protein [Micromonospora sp. DR5-3]|uniref:Rieske 2Fe-2S domain-containing protein n=1 Tax=unclassified Micromonospora TaxID=2617518 RepID=UPI0011DACAAA|nr:MULTISPECIES: Rieske 2Fe-2S domain-containing protein [unclassified Micromonospora]MCW3817970.1 Rieske 2Fe-2S domain-containing protein [Micromonospora sp. DR5-3]TYC21425.1 Rieske 2Fe-2S domain-containing protein [Micromonospora sp. MP36]
MRAGLMNKLERASALDRVGDRLQPKVWSLLRPQRVKDALHGVWLGHPLHPALVQVPMGAWMSSVVLDLMPGRRTRGQERAATTLVAVGTVSALPAALTGINDWSWLWQEERRVGLVHAATNTLAVALYAGSLAARLRGRHQLGRMFGLFGLTAVSAGGYLGGHLVYKQTAQVNQGAPDMHRVEYGWRWVAEVDSLQEGQMLARRVDNVPVVVYRDGTDITVMLARCAHQSGPLDQGKMIQVDGQACVVCPWHGSTFQMKDGEVVHGPSSTDQQVLPTRITDGVLEAALP